MSTDKTYHQDATAEHIDFEALDARGRKVGAQIIRQTVTFSPLSEGVPGWVFEPGTYYAWRASATRNGKPYGATQRENICTTAEEREAAIAKYLNGARKRAEKKG